MSTQTFEQGSDLNLPSTVQALAIAQTGDIDVVELMTLPFPKVEPGHIVVKIEYIGVNFIDTYFRKGLYILDSFPATLGEEAAGVIAKLPTDPAVLVDPNYQRWGFEVGGTVAVARCPRRKPNLRFGPWARVFPTRGVSTRITAASVSGATTAITFLSEAYPLTASPFSSHPSAYASEAVVFIHTIAGGLGLLLTQYAKHLGAKLIIGTTSTSDKAQLARSHGADEVILYKEAGLDGIIKRVMELTGGRGVDVVFDGVGKDTFEMDFEILARKGTLVSVGNASGAVEPFSPLKLMPKNIKLLRPTVGKYCVTPDEVYYYVNKVFELVSSGVLKVDIYKEYPFTTEGGRQAQRDLVGGKTMGKLIIKVSDQ
ncbi:NAD-P-binding protein [Gymnopus androsaceus JB14]|uniref:NAD-P-binding protein n=1 Tax=Gymnopus androsaceus JB14 TaxID=1447944 RepID=A0A6A4HZC3_9AGAR|nr:NAD-P-binding protein [Gymnopus androsaceus JB14]